jgi:hypothetical protein
VVRFDIYSQGNFSYKLAIIRSTRLQPFHEDFALDLLCIFQQGVSNKEDTFIGMELWILHDITSLLGSHH